MPRREKLSQHRHFLFRVEVVSGFRLRIGDGSPALQIQEDLHFSPVRLLRDVGLCADNAYLSVCLFDLGKQHVQHAQGSFSQFISAAAFVNRIPTARYDDDADAGLDKARSEKIPQRAKLARVIHSKTRIKLPDIAMAFDDGEVAWFLAGCRSGSQTQRIGESDAAEPTGGVP